MPKITHITHSLNRVFRKKSSFQEKIELYKILKISICKHFYLPQLSPNQNCTDKLRELNHSRKKTTPPLL